MVLKCQVEFVMAFDKNKLIFEQITETTVITLKS